MDLYGFVRLMHILCAIAWVGGGLTLIAQASFRPKDADGAEILRMTQGMGILAMKWFLPSSALTFLFGVALAVMGNLWSQPFVILGLAGFAATFLTGHFILRVRGEAVVRLLQAGEMEKAVGEALALMRVSKFDYTIVLMVVVVMVLKPQWDDQVLLAVIGAMVLLAALVFLTPRRSH